MDVNQGYPAWLTQISSENSTLTQTFDDESGVLFNLSNHITAISQQCSDTEHEAESD